MERFSKIILLLFLGSLIFISSQIKAADATPPNVSIVAVPSSATSTWQKSPAKAYIFCSDASGCDATSYKLKLGDSSMVCNTLNYDTDYSFCSGVSCNNATNSQSISSHQWVCGAAKDNASNTGFSQPVEFKVDTNPPTGTISATPTATRVNQNFNVISSGLDDIAMGAVCYHDESTTTWNCSACGASATSCVNAFSRKETKLGIKKYYGYLLDAVNNSAFTIPTYATTTIETDASITTMSATGIGTIQANLNGNLTSLGYADSAEVWFQYGTTLSYGFETSHVIENASGTFSIVATGLSQGTDYYFRAVVKNGVGTSYGTSSTFTTYKELITNGDFETNDLSGWTTTGTGNHQTDYNDKHGGSYAGLIGYKTAPLVVNGKSGLYQDVFVPASSTNIQLSLWYKFYTNDQCAYDFLNIYIEDTSGNILKTYLNCCCSNFSNAGCGGGLPSASCMGKLTPTYGWASTTDDLSAFSGQTIRIYFEVENRVDSKHRSWAYIDDVSIKYISTGPPSVVTNPASGIQTNSVILNGKLFDLGKAKLANVWFVWATTSHANWQDYPNQTQIIPENSAGPFATGIGNLSASTTYHYRAMASNGADTVSGNDVNFSTLFAAAGGWVRPVTSTDPDGTWIMEPKAYDGDPSVNSYASNNGVSDNGDGPGYHGYIYLILANPITSNKIRVCADYPPDKINVDNVDIDVLKDGVWTDILTGDLPIDSKWNEVSFPQGQVTQARFRFHYTVAGQTWKFWLYEFQFYQVPSQPLSPPALITLPASSIEENSAVLHGQVTDDGGQTVQFRFQYGPTAAYGMTTPWEGSRATNDNFGRIVTGLTNWTTYHFQAQASSSGGVSSGADETFYTHPASSGWVSPVGFLDPTGNWENGGYAFDDDTGYYSYAQTYRPYSPTTTFSTSTYITFIHNEIYSDKIEFMAAGPPRVSTATVAVSDDGTNWIPVFNGKFADQTWIVAPFNATSTGGKVTQARINFYASSSNEFFYYQLFEFKFWKIAQIPTIITSSTKPTTTQAILYGKLTDLGGSSNANVWFVWDRNPHDNWKDYASSSSPKTLSLPGDTSTTASNLLSLTDYHFRAVASNTAGTAFGDDLIFTTVGKCTLGNSTTSTSTEGCSHTLLCQSDGTWPPTPRDECDKTIPIQNPNCACQGISACIDADGDGYKDDWLSYPAYGNCNGSCGCNIASTTLGDPCYPTTTTDDGVHCSKPPAAKNLYTTPGDYCSINYAPVHLSWDFSDLNLPPQIQSAYRVEIASNTYPDFSKIVNRSCNPDLTNPDAACSSPTGYYSPQGLQYDSTYYWRVKVWNSHGDESPWAYPPNDLAPNSTTSPPGQPFQTEPGPPIVDFSWSPKEPKVDELIKFLDLTYCPLGCNKWKWNFDGIAESASSSPYFAFTTSGTHTVTLIVTDWRGCECKSDTKGIEIHPPVPKYKETPPD